MESRLSQLLASFVRESGEYSLARLEFALRFPDRESPPLLARLTDHSERTLRREWDSVEAQLEAVAEFLKQIDRQPRSRVRSDPAFTALARNARELDQYARALRWVLTVTEKGA